MSFVKTNPPEVLRRVSIVEFVPGPSGSLSILGAPGLSNTVVQIRFSNGQSLNSSVQELRLGVRKLRQIALFKAAAIIFSSGVVLQIFGFLLDRRQKSRKGGFPEMKHLPTDLEILNRIYDDYYKSFASFSRNDPDRETKIYIPIDIQQISGKLGVDVDIVFGRLYYHLEKRYGYKNDDGSSVHLFSLAAGKDRHCVNFPYAASVLAALRDENRKYKVATTIAVVALIISIVSICVAALY